MKKNLSLILCFLLLILTLTFRGMPADSDALEKSMSNTTVENFSDEITIPLPTATANNMTASVPDSSGQLQNIPVACNLEDYESNEALVVYTDGSMQLQSFDNKDQLSQSLDALSNNSEVAFIQPNYIYTADGKLTNDTLSAEQWALHNDGSFVIQDSNNKYPVFDNPFADPSMPGSWTTPKMLPSEWNNRSTYQASNVSSVNGIDINIQDAWAVAGDSDKREVIIALIDTGVYTSHEDFGDAFWINSDEIPGNKIDDDNNGYIDDINGWNFYNGNNNTYTGSEDNHGTHGAGSIGANKNNGKGIAGITDNDSVKIMVLKALGGSDGTGSTQGVIDAIKYAESNGAVICNLSMGTDSYDKALYNAMSASNMLFVVSAGNVGKNNDITPSYPSSFNLNNIISTANLSPGGVLHSSSNYGNTSVDIAVPGTYILGLSTENTYGYMTGTSMSAPILSSVAAMLYSYYSALTLTDVKSIILETASPLDSLNGKILTGGMLNAGAAMQRAAALKNSTCITANATLPFNDVHLTDSSYCAISYLYNRGIMIGTSDTTFSPSNTLTRAMTVTLLGRIAYAAQEDQDVFADVQPGTWYSGYIGWAVDCGIIVGYGNGYFGTNDAVLAYQMDLMLERYAATLDLKYDSGLSGDRVLSRAETAQAIFDFCQWLN